MIANNQNIETIGIETERAKEIIVIEKGIENMMIEEIEKIETEEDKEKEKEKDREIKTEKIKNNNRKILNKLSIMITNYYLIKYQCQFRFLCPPSQDNVVEGKDPDHHLGIIEETKIITKVNFGTLFHGYQELITLPMFHHQLW